MWHRRFKFKLAVSLSLFYQFTSVHGLLIQDQLSESSITSNTERWDLSEKPNLNDTTSNFIFETANSLLQHWPNTRHRNGHTLAPAIIPSGTLLYHGTNSPEIPQVPEWVAMDPDHSYLFCGMIPYPSTNSSNGEANTKSEEGWHLTFVTTQPLKLLYFDGSSAAQLPDGPLDTQDLLAWGETREDMVAKERERIDKLCEWAKNRNVDGFVRMEMSFEVMLCDFTVGLARVTSLRVHTPLRVIIWPRRPPPKLVSPHFRAIETGSWSNRFPGDQRIKIHYSRLISFYDKDLFPNLHLRRVGQERWDHRLKGINDAELDGLRLRLEEAFMESERESVVDWKSLLHVVTNRFADRLELLQYLLENTTTSEEALWKAHNLATNMLSPYILHDSAPPDNSTRNDHNWAAPVFKYCASTHTQYLEASLLTNLTASERLLLNAVRGVSKEICRVLVSIWAEGKEKLRGPEAPNPAAQHPGENRPDERIHEYNDESRNLLLRWKSSVSDLMAWLDWSVWVRCRPECSHNEMCYLPTWPYFLRFENPEDWKRPRPMCILRIEPFDL